MEKYNFTETKDNIFWDEFILQSENKNIYTLSDYLSLEDNIKFFIIKQTEEIIAAIALKVVNREIVPCKYLPQTPLIYKINAESNDYKKNKTQQELIEAIKDFLLNNFNKGSFVLDFRTKDIRPFLWENKKKIDIINKYTLLIDLKKIDNDDFAKSNLYKNFSPSKRKEINRSEKENYKFIEKFSSNLFLQLTKETYEMHGDFYDNIFYEKLIKKLKILNEKKFIKMFIIYKNDEVASFSVISTINKFSMNLFYGRKNKFDKDRFLGTFMIRNIFKFLKKNNFKYFDFEGMNSPKNSFFKMSYGGSLTSYYKVIF